MRNSHIAAPWTKVVEKSRGRSKTAEAGRKQPKPASAFFDHLFELRKRWSKKAEASLTGHIRTAKNPVNFGHVGKCRTYGIRSGPTSDPKFEGPKFSVTNGAQSVVFGYVPTYRQTFCKFRFISDTTETSHFREMANMQSCYILRSVSDTSSCGVSDVHALLLW